MEEGRGGGPKVVSYSQVGSQEPWIAYGYCFVYGNFVVHNMVRYGLYGCPLDPVLFDAIPQASTPQQNSPVVNSLSTPSLASKGATVTASSISSSSDQEPWISVNSSLASQGLLEVQPLHFVCCSTSDGARVERSDIQPVTGSLGPAGAPTTVPLMSSAMTMPPSAALPTVSASLAALEQELQMLKVATF